MRKSNSPIAQTTRNAYARIATMLRSRAIARHQFDPMPLNPHTAAALALELLQSEPQVSAATARLYRAAVLWDLDNREYEADDLDRAMSLLEQEDGPEEMERGDLIRSMRRNREREAPRGAQQKATHLSLNDIQLLVDTLRLSTARHSNETADWFAATLLTGLRPIEWRNASIVSDWLIVQNAKHSQGRSHGPIRRMHLASLVLHERACLDRHLETAQRAASEGRFAELYHGCRDLLRRTADKLWPGRAKHPALYTARHIFGAGAKNSWPPDKVAALMGHGSVHSAAQYYAKRQFAVGPVSVEPHWEDVEAVRARKAIQYLDSLKMRTQTTENT